MKNKVGAQKGAFIKMKQENIYIYQWVHGFCYVPIIAPLNFPKRPYSSINTLIYNTFIDFYSIFVFNHPVEFDTEWVYVPVRSWIAIHMPLNDMQICRAESEANAYTLEDRQRLPLLIEPNGSKSWRFRYRFAGKSKMISLGVSPTITLADACSRRDDARKLFAEGKSPSEVRKEQKIALQMESHSASVKIATEWHQMKSTKWSVGYASDIMETLQNDIFPYVGMKPIGEIKPLKLLNVLRKIEKRWALE